MNIQLEFAVAQKCDLAIVGESGYGNLVYQHMCCGFPLSGRGEVPHRCICPPKVRLEQHGYDCKNGNPLACIGATGGFIGVYFNVFIHCE